MEHNQKIDDIIKQRFKEKVLSVKTDLGDVVIQVEKDAVKEVLEFLKKVSDPFGTVQFSQCIADGIEYGIGVQNQATLFQSDPYISKMYR